MRLIMVDDNIYDLLDSVRKSGRQTRSFSRAISDVLIVKPSGKCYHNYWCVDCQKVTTWYFHSKLLPLYHLYECGCGRRMMVPVEVNAPI